MDWNKVNLKTKDKNLPEIEKRVLWATNEKSPSETTFFKFMGSLIDNGKYIDHATHEKIAAERFFADKNFKKFFSDAERLIIKEAIEDHRSSFEDTPRSDYGKLISSADRNSTIEIVFIRSFFVGHARTPDMTVEEFLEFTLNRIRKRYSEEDSENMFFEDEVYSNFLSDMRALLANGDEFKKRYCEVNNIKNRQSKLINEPGVDFYLNTADNQMQ